ncbi:MAG TPA: cupredoxin domain-containing protein [Polyangiaceae bacterium]|nr:cupredoxin domain-containing protein [Polyangiaceae bacterium]
MVKVDLASGALLRAAWLVAFAACGGGDGGPDDAQVIKVVAQQWSFSPNTITVLRGQTVDFEVTSSDVHHGFNLPDFGMRADVVPDQTTKVRVTFDKPGTYNFHCDYYCGSGHEGMSGQVVVQ